jgi:ankyrin repeat protein
MNGTKGNSVALALALLCFAIPSHPLQISDNIMVLQSKCGSGKQSACKELARIAISDPDAKVRSDAAFVLTDQSLLAKIAINDPNADVRSSAVYQLTDRSLLARIAAEDKDADVRNAAKRNLGRMCVDAARRGDTSAVQTLLTLGADANSTDESGYTALMYASADGYIEIVQALLNKGANVNVTETDRGYAEGTANGIVIHQGDTNTALSLASANGHHEIVEMLLKAGAK